MVKITKIAMFSLLVIGSLLVIVSIVYSSSFLAILGVAIIFFSAIFSYIKPVEHVPLTLLSAVYISSTRNIEMQLARVDLSVKSKYLPPKYLGDSESSLVIIPQQKAQSLQEVNESKITQQSHLIFVPPGRDLCNLFEKEIGVSFIKKDLCFVEDRLPNLICNMELAEDVDLQINNDKVLVKIKGNKLMEVSKITRNFPKTHALLGCLISSAVACVLARASGKVVTIEKDDFSADRRVTTIEFKLCDE